MKMDTSRLTKTVYHGEKTVMVVCGTGTLEKVIGKWMTHIGSQFFANVVLNVEERGQFVVVVIDRFAVVVWFEIRRTSLGRFFIGNV